MFGAGGAGSQVRRQPVPRSVGVARFLLLSERKRLRNFSEVRLAPSTLRGKTTGPAVDGLARQLDGAEAERARSLLANRFPVMHGKGHRPFGSAEAVSITWKIVYPAGVTIFHVMPASG